MFDLYTIFISRSWTNKFVWHFFLFCLQDELNDDNIFGDSDGFGGSDADTMMGKSDHTNWADFDAFFNNLQMNDNSRFAGIDSTYNRASSNIGLIQPSLNNLNEFDWDEFESNTNVATFPSSTNGDLKQY